ncbi:hypothetical protein Golob_024739 [Gossypium lobatum]|uniref:Uncharacterized protein n=1 Tax=Gossypium lobatum TaxID=34289 RepID=A0A7J8NKI3_9ROSI|nr:hypothetical protein [Gossypium lobatum]
MVTSSGELSLRRNARTANAESKQLSPLSIATLQNVKDRPHQKHNSKLPGGTVRHFDNNDPHYSLLLVGWLAKERRVPSGRLYRVVAASLEGLGLSPTIRICDVWWNFQGLNYSSKLEGPLEI